MGKNEITTNTGASTSSAKKILIFEDDKFYSNIFPIKFKQAGFEAHVANSAQEGLELAKSLKPDIILLDLIMPLIDGFEVLKQLKSDPELKAIPVIVISNLGQKTDIDKAKSMGAMDYLVKANISLQEAVDKVKSLLG